jgi:AcrR family transcriptional regulator
VLSNLPGENPQHPDELAQLPHGRHGLPAEFVERNQRERLIASFTALVGEVGFSGATISATTEGAGVSSRTFYKYFETIEDCCIAAFEKALDDVRPLVIDAFLSQSEWPASIHAVLTAVLSEFAEFSDTARLLTAEPFVAGPRIATRHIEVIQEMVPFLRAGREYRDTGTPLPETTEKGLLAAANSMIARHLLASGGEGLTKLTGDLTQFILTPYLGPLEAHRVAGS